MKKSIVISLLAAAIICCTALCSFASTGVVTTDTLRLRKEASKDSTIIELLSINDEVEILGEENGWYKVNATVDSVKYTGYVSKDYIRVKENKTNTDENKVQEDENDTKEENKVEEDNTVKADNEIPQEPADDGEIQEPTENKTYVKVLTIGAKVHATPVVNSMIINTTEEEKQVNIISEVNGWSYIEAVGVKGWVMTENIAEKEASEPEQSNTSSQKTGYISGSSVNFREEAKTSGKVISKLKRNAQVKVISEENGWAKVEYAGKTGYVSSDYISDKKQETTSRTAVDRKANTKSTETKKETVSTKTTESKTSTTSKGKATGAEIVSYAKKYIGSKYKYGGSSPSGFDCSGFTSYVYKHFGYSLSRTSSAQSSNR